MDKTFLRRCTRCRFIYREPAEKQGKNKLVTNMVCPRCGCLSYERSQKWPVHHSRDGVWSTGGIARHSDDDFYVEILAFDRDMAAERGELIYLIWGGKYEEFMFGLGVCDECGMEDIPFTPNGELSPHLGCNCHTAKKPIGILSKTEE